MFLKLAKWLANKRFGQWAVFAIEAAQTAFNIYKGKPEDVAIFTQLSADYLYDHFAIKFKNSTQKEVELSLTLAYLFIKSTVQLFQPNEKVIASEALVILGKYKE